MALGAGGLGRAAPFALTQRSHRCTVQVPGGASWLSASRAASAASSLPLRCRRRCPLWSHLPRLRRPRCPHRFRAAASPRFDQVHAAPPPRGPPQSCATPPSALRGHRRGHRAPDSTPHHRAVALRLARRSHLLRPPRHIVLLRAEGPGVQLFAERVGVRLRGCKPAAVQRRRPSCHSSGSPAPVVRERCGSSSKS